MTRRNIAETWVVLNEQGFEMPLASEGEPLVPDAMPNHDDDEPLGFSFFRTGLDGESELSDLTLPRTFFGRSAFSGVSFRNTSLAESRICWNDFEQCDFSYADLTGCDLRASNFQSCTFDAAVLKGADLRNTGFVDCTFVGADFAGATADLETGDTELRESISADQRSSITWAESAGPEAPGG